MRSPGERHSRFCVLGYRGQHIPNFNSEQGTAIAVAFLDEHGKMNILVDPNLRAIVNLQDWPYFESLFEDFRHRSDQDPKGLFEQLCNLNVGMLVTLRVAKRGSDFGALSGRVSGFLPIWDGQDSPR